MASQQLPSDIIFEILSLTPLQTLDRCKCVCNDWKRHIDDDPSFMPLYCRRTNNLSGFFIQTVKPLGHASAFVSVNQQGMPLPVRPLPHDTKLLASSDQGILCCVKSKKYRNHRYYVHKPSTGQWRALPNPKLRYWTVAVGMVVKGSNPLRFKIVRLSKKGLRESDNSYQYRCEIFNSTSWIWREAREPTVTVPYSDFIWSPTLLISGKGMFYWLRYENSIVAFSEPTESFHMLPLPETMLDNHEDYRMKKLVEYEGKLGLSCVTKEGMVELWAMEGDPVAEKRIEWTKQMSVDIGKVEESFAYPYPAGFNKGGTLLLKAYDKAVFYSVGDCNFSAAKLDFEFRFATEIFPFRSDLDDICFC